MYVYFNGKRVSWYIPGVDPDQTVKLDTATFTPKMLPKGRIEQGGNSPPPIVIPDVPNRISTRKDGYIELILSRHYDKEAHQSRNKKVIIGQDASGFLPGMMFPNDNYFDHFDHSGRLINDSMQAEETNGQTEEEADEKTKEATKAKAAAEAKEKGKTEPTDPKTESRMMNKETEHQEHTQPEHKPQSNPQSQPKPQPQPTPVTDEALTAREQAIQQKETELAKKAQKLLSIQQQLAQVQEQQLMEQNEALRNHVYLLNRILEDYIDAIEQQVKRKPDTPMSLKQIRTINEILRELRDIFTGSESDPFLHLAEEPDPDHDNPGTTYGEMNLLLSAYHVTANAFHYGELRKKKA